jgi:uncharacterized delta-60 repeat protein
LPPTDYLPDAIFGDAHLKGNTKMKKTTSPISSIWKARFIAFLMAGSVIAGLTGYYHQLRSVSIQANGQIVASGLVYQTSGHNLWALARFQNNGSRDTTYGTSGNGIVVTDFPGVSESCSASVLQSDGRLIGAGYSNNMANILLARYLP